MGLKYCDKCNEVVDYYTRIGIEVLNVKGQAVSRNIIRTYCRVCNNEIYHRENEILNDINVYGVARHEKKR